MSDRLDRYRAYESQLAWLRWMHAGLETEDEEQLMDEIERLWWEMTTDEHQIANGELVPTLTTCPPPLMNRDTIDSPIWTTPGPGIRRVVERRV